ncbi:RNA polymerase sigma factor [Streptomyces sp. NRRL S-37]|uniref:RNA polymerase sigma factor n=1 Tax=Streptomyces sp. NRRL S-37 TaxID=1463903 RepID=UPI00056B0A7E|nr:RNA polymerase sigma factor [Streptomyces sp. NRRL S-37]
MPSSDAAQPPPHSVRRGRPPAPISPEVGPLHRAWLEPVRNVHRTSGLTLDDLVDRSGYSKTRISELLRGNGYYPAWEITFSVIRALDIPTEPMRRLWTAAAREARKGPEWIRQCIEQVAHEAEGPPLPYQAFTETMRHPYLEYARAFLLTDRRAQGVVAEANDILWLSWNEATASANLNRYAWLLLRSRVMLRAPRHEGHPDLRAAVFSTREIRTRQDPGHMIALSELVDLFDAISRLPDDQMDVAVLHYLCGIPDQRIPHVLGLSPAIAHAVDHHARATVEALLGAPDTRE